MTQYLDTVSKSTTCPYCGESIEIVIDRSVEYQEYIEDCFVCCRPIVIKVSVYEEDKLSIGSFTDQD